MADQYLRDLAPWPVGTALPANGLFLFYAPDLDQEFKLLPEQLPGTGTGAGTTELTTAQLAAVQQAHTPTGTNPFATLADLMGRFRGNYRTGSYNQYDWVYYAANGQYYYATNAIASAAGTFFNANLWTLLNFGSGASRDLLDLSTTLMDAVMGLTYTDGDAPLSGTPAGSYPGQWFDALDTNGDAWRYSCGRGNYTPGTAGSGVGPRWSRAPKG